MDDVAMLFAGPFLTSAFSIIILVGFPWLLPVFVAPWILMWGPMRAAARRAGGYRMALMQSTGGGLWMLCGLFVLVAQLVPLSSTILAAITGKRPLREAHIVFDLSAGSCMSSMMLFTLSMALFCGLAWNRPSLRYLNVACCCLPAIALEVYYVYGTVGSGDGQAAFVYPASPIYGHLAASVVASLFAAPPFWRWWRTRVSRSNDLGPD